MDTSISLPQTFTHTSQNIPVMRNNMSFLDNSVPFQLGNVEYCYQNQLKELESYLGQILDEQKYAYKPGTEEEENLSITKAKAKEYFVNHVNETFRHVKSSFDEFQLHHLMPKNYMVEVFDNMKESLDYNLHKLTDDIKESLVVKHNPTDLSKNSFQIPKKTNKKGKTKIPKKALTVLKNWLTEHFQDPYPSHDEKIRLAKEAGVSFKQVQNWFTNARGRIWRRTFNPEKFSAQVEGKLIEKNSEPHFEQEYNPYINTNFSVYPINAPPQGNYFLTGPYMAK